jgi:hypothetical protein
MKKIIGSTLVVFLLCIFGCGEDKAVQEQEPTQETELDKDEKAEPAAAEKETKEMATDIQSLIAQFAPTEIGVEEGKIPDKQKKVIKKLIEAAGIVDKLFFAQVSDKNVEWRKELMQDPTLADTKKLFDIMYGPWNRLDHNRPFFGNIQKPKGATFYPEDLTKEEIEKWIAEHPDQKDEFTGYFTVIKRDGDALKAVPYSEEYKDKLDPAAKLLEEAADLSGDKRLKKYLKSRAKAFRDNDYRPSDMDWMDLGDGGLEVVIGPYEVYEDELMGYKAAFEAFVALRDPEESKKLDRIKELKPKMEAYLPIPDKYKNPNRGSDLPISVVDVLFTAGDTRAGVQTLAFNLPNDEVVREKKGFKLVMLKNVSHAKYDKILIPIAKHLMRADQVEKISHDAFFNHSVVHETAHGLGPGKIKIERDGKKIDTTVNAELKDLYPAIEECKADILGTYLNYFLIEKGMFNETFTENMYASLLGGFFRSVRFGANEAHGKANLIQFNWLVEKRAIVFEDGKYAYVSEKMREAVKSLAAELLMIEALGDYERAARLLDNYGKMPDSLLKSLDSLKGVVPTDIIPRYPAEKLMASW